MTNGKDTLIGNYSILKAKSAHTHKVYKVAPVHVQYLTVSTLAVTGVKHLDKDRTDEHQHLWFLCLPSLSLRLLISLSLISSYFHKILSPRRHESETQREDKRKKRNKRGGEEGGMRERSNFFRLHSVVLTRPATFYRCSFSVNLGKSESNGVG